MLPSPELLKRAATATAPTTRFSGGAGAAGGDGGDRFAHVAPSQLLPAAIPGSELGSRIDSGVHAAAAEAVAAKLRPIWPTLNKRLMAADRDAGGQRPRGDGSVPAKLAVNPTRAGALPWATVDGALRASGIVLEPAERAWIIATFAGTLAGRNNTSNNGLAATTTAEVAYPQLMQHVAMSARRWQQGRHGRLGRGARRGCRRQEGACVRTAADDRRGGGASRGGRARNAAHLCGDQAAHARRLEVDPKGAARGRAAAHGGTGRAARLPERAALPRLRLQRGDHRFTSELAMSSGARQSSCAVHVCARRTPRGVRAA